MQRIMIACSKERYDQMQSGRVDWDLIPTAIPEGIKVPFRVEVIKMRKGDSIWDASLKVQGFFIATECLVDVPVPKNNGGCFYSQLYHLNHGFKMTEIEKKGLPVTAVKIAGFQEYSVLLTPQDFRPVSSAGLPCLVHAPKMFQTVRPCFYSIICEEVRWIHNYNFNKRKGNLADFYINVAKRNSLLDDNIIKFGYSYDLYTKLQRHFLNRAVFYDWLIEKEITVPWSVSAEWLARNWAGVGVDVESKLLEVLNYAKD